MSKKFEIPQAINYDRMDDQDYVECHEASWSNPKQLKKAEGDISNAIDLCEKLRGQLIEEEA